MQTSGFAVGCVPGLHVQLYDPGTSVHTPFVHGFVGRQSIVSTQVKPSPVKPLLQAHPNDPTVSVQTALASHGEVSHSIMLSQPLSGSVLS